MKKRDRKRLDKVNEENLKTPPKSIENMQKKAKLKIINKDIQDDTEELNVLMSKEKASKIMQFVSEKAERTLCDIDDKLKVVKCLDRFYNKFYADCFMKFKNSIRDKTFCPELLENVKISNKLENCVSKIEDLTKKITKNTSNSK